MTIRHIAATSAVVVLAFGSLALGAPAASAATITVTNLSESGPGSLRAAVETANLDAAFDEIRFQAGLTGTIPLLTNLTSNHAISIVGPGSAVITIGRAGALTFNQFDFLPLENAAPVSISGLTFDGAPGNGGSAISIDSSVGDPGDVTISDVVIREQQGFAGPAIRLEDVAGTIRISDSLLEDNEAYDYGGAIYGTGLGGDIEISDSTFLRNESDDDGGAIHISASQSRLTVTRSDFGENDTANLTASGGAIYFSSTNGEAVSIIDSHFNDNTAARDGGALFINTDSTVSISGTEFEINQANESAGAVMVEGSTGFTGTGNTYVDNRSVTGGGAVYVGGTPDASETASTFRGNESVNNRGGAINLSLTGTGTIASSQFVGNTAGVAGGAVGSLDLDELVIRDSVFDDNDTGGDGGAIFIEDLDEFEITGSAFVANESYASGGGVYIGEVREDGSIVGSSFTDNHTRIGGSGYGGGMAIGDQLAGVSVSTSSFLENTTQLGGGGLAVSSLASGLDEGLSITNSTFADNEINAGFAQGSSLFVDSLTAPVFVQNSTIDDEDTGSNGYAAYFEDVEVDGSAVTITNSTILGAGGVGVDRHESGAVRLNHSILAGASDSPALLGLGLTNATPGFELELNYDILSNATQPYYDEVAGNRFSVSDLKLGPLQANGGPTLTRLPDVDSLAHNGGDPAVEGPGALDQRGAGFDRVVQIIDVGAVEVQAERLAATGVASSAPGWTIAALLLLLGGGLALTAARLWNRQAP